MSRYAARRDKLRRNLKKAGLDALLVTNFTNVTYLTGFSGDDSYLLLLAKDEIVVSDPRYTTQLVRGMPGAGGLDPPARHRHGRAVAAIAGKARKVVEAGHRRLVDDGRLRDQIAAGLPKTELVATANLVEQLRVVKDKDEVAEIRRAIWQAERAFNVLRASLRPERTEKEVADELDSQMRAVGAKGCSFPPIIAVGARAALPHARPTDQRIGADDFVLVDWGADGGPYKSDLTRVLVTGKISPKLERIYRVVLSAQEQAIAAIRAGSDLPRSRPGRPRRYCARPASARNFGHGLGHGIGLEIHEAPRLAASQHVKLEAGHGGHGRAGNLPARLGRGADRRRRAGHQRWAARC